MFRNSFTKTTRTTHTRSQKQVSSREIDALTGKRQLISTIKVGSKEGDPLYAQVYRTKDYYLIKHHYDDALYLAKTPAEVAEQIEVICLRWANQKDGKLAYL